MPFLQKTTVKCLAVSGLSLVVGLSASARLMRGQESETVSAPPELKQISSVAAQTPSALSSAETDTDVSVQQFTVSAVQHPWAKFPLGAWRESRVTTETAGQQDQPVSRSVTTQVETLRSVTPEHYSLEVQATVELAGRRIDGQKTSRVLLLSTDGPGQVLGSQRLKDENLALSVGIIACEVWEVSYSEESHKLVDRIHYSTEQFPHIFHRETSLASSGEASPVLLKVTSTVARDVPYQVGDDPLLCTCLKMVQHGEKGTSERISMVSPEVPGGTVARWTTEFSPEGERLRWSSQMLVGYGTGPRSEKPLTRRQIRRARRNP